MVYLVLKTKAVLIFLRFQIFLFCSSSFVHLSIAFLMPIDVISTSRALSCHVECAERRVGRWSSMLTHRAFCRSHRTVRVGQIVVVVRILEFSTKFAVVAALFLVLVSIRVAPIELASRQHVVTPLDHNNYKKCQNSTFKLFVCVISII